MDKDKENSDGSELRHRAEKQKQTEPAGPEEIDGMSTKDMAKMIHELRVHQIELKMQNEELRRIQEELEEARDRYSHLFDFSPVGYLTVNEKGIVEGANLTFATLMGMERSAVVGKPFSRFVQREDQDVYYLNSQRLLESGALQSFTLRLTKNDGSDFFANLECMLIRENVSAPKQIRIVVSDITEQKKLEWRLWQAQKMESIAKLAGGIAHQFNNALFVIVATTDLLEMQVPNDEMTSEYFDSIKKSTARMTKLTRQLLAYARGGKYEVKDISLSVLVRNTLPLLQHTLDPSISVETNLPDDISKTRGDLTQLVMVLSILLSNSTEAIESEGHIKITCRNELITKEDVKTFPGLLPGPYVSLTVEDNGRGMDEETKKRVFEPFFTTKFLGRGLGLAATYGIVKNHGGWISIESQLDRGTSVRIYLPAVREIKEKKAQRVHKEPLKGTGTILLIEDELAVIETLRKLLERLGYKVLEAKTGKGAIRLVRAYEGEIDLAILDVFLPDMNGNKVYPLLKEFRPDMKVLVFSGYSIEGPAQEILDAGAHGFVQKPVSAEELSEKLKQLLQAG
ncbi:MAG: response regulator [Desulfobacterales bacterium]|jgi:PAS domain S-box-containing protein